MQSFCLRSSLKNHQFWFLFLSPSLGLPFYFPTEKMTVPYASPEAALVLFFRLIDSGKSFSFGFSSPFGKKEMDPYIPTVPPQRVLPEDNSSFLR